MEVNPAPNGAAKPKFEHAQRSLTRRSRADAANGARSFGLFLLALLIATTACSVLTPSEPPTIVILSPPSGSVLHEGDDVAVQSTATDSAGVVRVELVVDDTVVRTDSLPPAQGQVSVTLTQTWKATQGSHIILVRAFNAAGKESSPVAVSVTVLPSATPTATATLVATLIPPTVSPTVTNTVCTDAAVFVADVSVPDGTLLAAGQTFDKTWRVRNTGCPWDAGYHLAFVSGEAMSTVKTIPLPDTATGATADLSVSMTAPTVPGAHNGTWRLRNPKGVLFGTIVTVKINVPGAPSPTNTSAPVACSGTPNIASFTASQTIIVPLGSTTLNWGPVTNADSVEIDQGIGGVGSPGSLTVNPAGTTTYTMTAHCGSQTATAQVRILMPFAVTATAAFVDPSDYSGPCPKTVTVPATVTATDAGIVTYKWESSDGSNNSANLNMTFVGAGTQTVTTTWTLGAPGQTPSNYWARIHTLSPTDATSNNATFTLRCN